MALAIDDRPRGAERAGPLRLIDTDIHNDLPSLNELRPYLAREFHPWLENGGPAFARRYYTNTGSGVMDDSIREEDGLAAGDPDWTVKQLMVKYEIDLGILTGTMTGAVSVDYNSRFLAAIASAYNDWTLEKWVRPYDCFKGSIIVAPQDPEQAVAEIDRLAGEPGMVQVLIGSATEAPLGRRQYHPIYEACTRHDLPLALHLGGEGAGMSPPATAVGHPSTYFEWYGSVPQNYMAHIMSLVTEGVFEKFPTLKIVLCEGGIFWLPHIMWRFDKNWKAQRSETPWVKEPPSAYILRHFYSTTYPLEAAADPAHVAQVCEMIDAEHRLLYAGNYPHWEGGDPAEMLDGLPTGIRGRVLAENARAVYGERVGAGREA